MALTPFQQRVEQVLASTPLFSGLDGEDAGAIMALMERRVLARRAFLFRKGDPADRLYAVVSGCLKVCADSGDGRQVTFSVLGSGDIVGEVAVLGSTARSASVVAVSDCELASIERKRLEAVLAQRPAVLGALARSSTSRLLRLTVATEDAVFLSLDVRLARTLEDLATRFGRAGEGGIHIPFRQQDIADLLGASRESINKRLREWEERELLRLRRGGIVLGQIDALRSLTREAS